ncbi:MAG: class I SAM-dependent methyltransferase [Flavobacteriales bacterium]|nr:class I SAM-dependent methyltransferase [Flavobacteriales bacterium]MCC6937386.1 class I SAM-dependent methyltransferase [Flavobacteriales bacterium]
MRLSERLCLLLNRAFPKRGIEGRGSPGAYSEAQFHWAEKNYSLFSSSIDLKGKVVLDAGCGPGGKTLYYATKGCRSIVGVDLDPVRIGHAQQFLRAHPDVKVEFMVGDLSKLDFPADSFDVIFLNDVFEHVARPLLEQVLQELKRVLRPGGSICMEFPPWTSFDAGHLYDHIYIPWCQLIFSDRTLVNVLEHMQAKGPEIGSSSVIDHYLELNRITIPEARSLFHKLAFNIRVFRHERVKGIKLFAWWPWLDSLLTRRVVAVLGK